MENKKPFSRPFHMILLVFQFLLAMSLIWAGYMKLFTPNPDLAKMWPWVAEYPALVLITGGLDFLAALGLILPSILRIYPKLTVLAAIGLVALMFSATIFHILRGEFESIGLNIGFAVLGGFIAWGRWKKAPLG